MIQLNLRRESTKPLTVLCLGAHSDDIEIGCGGTLLKLCEQYPAIVLQGVVFSAIGIRAEEARRGAILFGGTAAGDSLLLKAFSDGFMPFEGAGIKAVVEELKHAIQPDLIFTHSRRDAHQDHRLLAEATWNTFRDHLILEYEIPKYDGDIGQPNVFVHLAPELCQKKVKYILDAFQSQRSKAWFEESTFLALMRLRGMESNAPGGYAEAFYCRKLVL
jgi:LmbE family N-acetylglucosaminyl deacetylase